MTEPATGQSLKCAVIGAGAWGSALANLMARRGRHTKLWGRDPDVIEAIRRDRQNQRYLPGITLNPELDATDNLAEAIADAAIVMLVTPAQTIPEMARAIKPFLDRNAVVIACAKGIDRNTGQLPAETLSEILGNIDLAVLSGPSFAHDVARDLPTAVTLAAGKIELATRLAETVSDDAFRVYASDDVIGVELGGALKNVIALAVGVCRGMALGASAEAALIARGFAEISRLATALGARAETLMGLSGLGDLVLTCSGEQSRNFAYGLALGQSRSTQGMKLAEGAFTAEIAERLALENNVDCPIISIVRRLVEHSLTPEAALKQLLSRPLKSESAR